MLCAASVNLSSKRKAAYEALHPETVHGAVGQRREKSRQVGDLKRFSKEAADKTGKSERVVQRNAQRGEAIRDDVLEATKGAHLDKCIYLDKLKDVPVEEQMRRVQADVCFSSS